MKKKSVTLKGNKISVEELKNINNSVSNKIVS